MGPVPRPDAGTLERVGSWPGSSSDGAAPVASRLVGRFDAPITLAGAAVVHGQDGGLVASTATGKPVWRYHRARAEVEAVHVASGDPWASRLPQPDDEQLWHERSTLATPSGGAVVARSTALLGLDLDTGRQQWRRSVGSQFSGLDRLDDHRVVLVGGLGGGREANRAPVVDARSGRIERRLEPFDRPGGAVAWHAADGLVAWRDSNVGPNEQALMVWSTRTDQQVWSRSGLPGPARDYSTPVPSGTRVYYVDDDATTGRATLTTTSVTDGNTLARTPLPAAEAGTSDNATFVFTDRR